MGRPGQRADLNLHQPLGGEGDHLAAYGVHTGARHGWPAGTPSNRAMHPERADSRRGTREQSAFLRSVGFDSNPVETQLLRPAQLQLCEPKIGFTSMRCGCPCRPRRRGAAARGPSHGPAGCLPPIRARPVAATVARPALSRSLPPIPSRLSRKSNKAPVPLGIKLLPRLRSGTDGKEAIMARGTEKAAGALPRWFKAPGIRRCGRNSQIRACSALASSVLRERNAEKRERRSV